MAITEKKGRPVFIRTHGDRIFIAEPSRKGSRKLIWSVMPRAPIAADARIESRLVPLKVRKAAYGLFERDRIRAKAGDPIRAPARLTDGPDGFIPSPPPTVRDRGRRDCSPQQQLDGLTSPPSPPSNMESTS
jgi:hypothetical protein